MGGKQTRRGEGCGGGKGEGGRWSRERDASEVELREGWWRGWWRPTGFQECPPTVRVEGAFFFLNGGIGL